MTARLNHTVSPIAQLGLRGRTPQKSIDPSNAQPCGSLTPGSPPGAAAARIQRKQLAKRFNGVRRKKTHLARKATAVLTWKWLAQVGLSRHHREPLLAASPRALVFRMGKWLQP
jgi:hypothetical protein